MKFILVTCVSASENWSQEAAALYSKKISHFVSFEIKQLKIKKSSRTEREYKLKSDSDALLLEILTDDFVVLFDERGECPDSHAFSEKMNKVFLSGKKRCLFLIGGAYGVDERIRSRANLKISFSKLVFNHLVAQTVALEQIYRGFTLLKNIPYHND